MPRKRSRRTALLATVMAIAAIIAGAAPVEARAGKRWTETRTQHYLVGDVGPLPDPLGQALTWPSCAIVTPSGGSLCFGSTLGDTFTVGITDDSGRQVGGIVIIEARNGRTHHRPFCGTTGPLPVVRGDLYVHLDAPGDVRGAHWYDGPGCTEIRQFGTAATTQGVTSGRVDVTFTTGRPRVARARGPVRSGSVLNPANFTGQVRCHDHPDCTTWLASRCDQRLAGAEPAAFTSIVNVRSLAGSTRRIRTEGGRWLSFGTLYEFWSADCFRVGSVPVNGGATVTIPRDAAWMTAPGSSGPYHWEMW